MKTLKYFLLSLILFCGLGLKAQTDGNVTGFTVLPAYLSSGRILISNTATTTVKIEVDFTRQYDYAVSSWKYTSISFALGTGPSLTLLHSPVTVTNSDFPANSAFLTKEFTVTITNANLIAGMPVVLTFKTPSMANPGYYTGKSYFYDVTPPPVVDPTIPINVYEYWSPSVTDHLFTLSPTDSRTWYNTSSAVRKAFATNISGTIPIYSYWNSGVNDHYYSTTNSPTIGGGGWVNEGPAFYAYASAGAGRVPVYSYWSASSTDHWYSVNNSPVVSGQWYNEGIVFYVVPL